MLAKRTLPIGILLVTVLAALGGSPRLAPAASLTLTSLGAGEVLQAGSSYTITWTAMSPRGYVFLFLYKGDQELSYLGGADILQESLVWNTCPSIGDGADYRLGFYDDYEYELHFSDFFTIAGSLTTTLTLTNPTGGETFQAGSTQPITWTSTNAVGNVSIWLERNGVWIADLGSVPMAPGHFDWPICEQQGDGSAYTLNLMWFCDQPHYVHSPAFGITSSKPPPSIRLLTPNGGETVRTGTDYDITWSTDLACETDPPEDVYLELYKGTEYCPFFTYSVTSCTSAKWHVCPNIPAGGDYSLRVFRRTCTGDIEDVSDAAFSVMSGSPAPQLTITSPNGGESLQAGTNTTITWTSANMTGYVTAHLDRGTTQDIFIGSAPVTDGKLSWNVCLNVENGSGYRIRLFYYDGCVIQDRSDADFSIVGAGPVDLNVTSPLAGTVVQAGTTQTITWTASRPVGDVNVDLFKAGEYLMSLASAPMANGQVDWPVCEALENGNDYTIRLRWSDCNKSYEVFSQPFTVTNARPLPTITLLNPNGGETVRAGEMYIVKWVSDPPSANPYADGVTLQLYKGGQPCSGLSYGWRGPTEFYCYMCPSAGDGSDYALRISRNTCSGLSDDFSDAPFSIVGSQTTPVLTLTSPVAGESIPAGTTQTITWAAKDPSGSVSIDLFKSGTYVNSIGYVPMADGRMDWPVCDTLPAGNDYTLRFSWYLCNRNEQLDSSPFTITASRPHPTITLVSPNGGETIQAGSQLVVTWADDPPVGDFWTFTMIELFKGGQWYDMAPYSFIAENTALVEICRNLPEGTDYSIRVSKEDCSGTIEDFSDATFSIVSTSPSPQLTLTSPKQGDALQAGGPITVTWTTLGEPDGYVNVTLYKGGNWFASLGGALMSAGSFTTTLCAVAEGSDFTVEISGGDCSYTSSRSAQFTISGAAPRPTFELTSPRGGESWAAGTTQSITWTSTNPNGQVSIELYRNGSCILQLGSVPMADGRFDWAICPFMPAGNEYAVDIRWQGQHCDGSLQELSNMFTVAPGVVTMPTLALTSPAAGETWAGETTHTITWTATNPRGIVYIYLYKAAEPVATLGSVPMEAGRFDWYICPVGDNGSDYTVRLNWSECFASAEVSSPLFAITGMTPRPQPDLTLPPYGTTWQAGTTHPITWTSMNPTGDITIELWKEGFPYADIGSAPMSAGRFDWTICPAMEAGTDYSLTLSWSYCGTVYQCWFGALLTMTTASPPAPPMPAITLTRPVGDETWTAGTTERITWTITDPIGEVMIYLRNSETNVNEWLGSVPMAAGEFNWTISPCDARKASLYYVTLKSACGTYASSGFFNVIAGAATPGDLDQDCDIDCDDLQLLSACSAGASVRYDPGQLPPGCRGDSDTDDIIPADLDRDGDVDMDDFGIVQRCYSGTGVAADPDCGK